MKFNRKSKPNIFTPRVIAVGFVFLSVFIVEFFFKTWCGVQCIRIGYEITDAMNKQQNLMNMQKNLTIELVHLQSPQVLMKIAKEKFELTIPEPDQVIVIP
ncbi:MAG: hypothetical protein HF978_10820 [Desulfobacteraceae bacterium]|nr:cell division protein FtsL [Desulfobacteraceae bacterium]MBC2756028.1 hypothetical protein [Desulfobacteraceae bacterium]